VADWSTISALATAGGTLVLAGATFAAVRSANRSARVTERALLAGLRPVLMPSRMQDPPEKVGFMDNHWVRVEGGQAVAEVTDDAIYLAIALRNAGSGVAVLDRWDFYPDRPIGDQPYTDPENWRRLTRDIYIAGGDLGFWQGAIRERSDPLFDAVKASVEGRKPMSVDLLYEDHEGGQRTITRIAMAPYGDDKWIATAGRHWNIDREDPR
jgi:hypothetical protein